MLHIFDFVRELTIGSVALRLVSAMIFGGLIGLERELKRRPAGFRTHILICLGAALTTLTSQYLFVELLQYTDVARLGAQVICGIGFIGAGTIIVVKGQRVKGLTTAAGLWTNAIVGLVCGAGYIEGAAAATLLVLIAEILMIKLEYTFDRQKVDMNLYVEYSTPTCVEEMVHIVKQQRVNMLGLEVTRSGQAGEEGMHYCAVLTIQPKGRSVAESIEKSILDIQGVTMLEEL